MKTCKKCGQTVDKLHTKEFCVKCYNHERFRKNYIPHPRQIITNCKNCGAHREGVRMIGELCHTCYCKGWRQENKNHVKDYQIKWTDKNKDKLNARRVKDRLKNPEKYQKQREKWLNKKNNRKKQKLYKTEYNKKYTERRKILDNKRRSKPEWKEKERIRVITKYYNNLTYNIYARMSRSIKYALSEKKKNRKWETIVQYTVEDLQKHICSLFTHNMTFKRLLCGEIHIDHIIPHSAFEYTSEHDDGFKLCWSLSNLQPKWAKENQSKNDRLPNGFLARNLTYKIKNKDDYDRVLNGGLPLADLTNYNCEI